MVSLRTVNAAIADAVALERHMDDDADVTMVGAQVISVVDRVMLQHLRMKY